MSTGQPDWDRLFSIALVQDGLFTTKQAAQAGYSPQLLAHYLSRKRATRLLRGVYRLVHFPASEHEDLVATWLWSEQAGVLSHQTALALHELSNVLPGRIHLTLPSAWKQRRLRLPPGVVLHHAEVPPEERAWFGAIPTTNPRRTLNDCAREGLSPELLRQAAEAGLRRGLVTKPEINDVEEALRPFGGLAP